jgi:hypothetical protein
LGTARPAPLPTCLFCLENHPSQGSKNDRSEGGFTYLDTLRNNFDAEHQPKKMKKPDKIELLSKKIIALQNQSPRRTFALV